MTNTDLLQNRSVMSVHVLNVCLLETLSGVVQCFSQLRLLPCATRCLHLSTMVEKLFILQGVGWRGNGGRWEGVRREEGEEGREGGQRRGADLYYKVQCLRLSSSLEARGIQLYGSIQFHEPVTVHTGSLHEIQRLLNSFQQLLRVIRIVTTKLSRCLASE